MTVSGIMGKSIKARGGPPTPHPGSWIQHSRVLCPFPDGRGGGVQGDFLNKKCGVRESNSMSGFAPYFCPSLAG